MTENERILQMKLDCLDKQMSKIMAEAATYSFPGASSNFVINAMRELKKLFEALN